MFHVVKRQRLRGMTIAVMFVFVRPRGRRVSMQCAVRPVVVLTPCSFRYAVAQDSMVWPMDTRSQIK